MMVIRMIVIIKISVTMLETTPPAIAAAVTIIQSRGIIKIFSADYGLNNT